MNLERRADGPRRKQARSAALTRRVELVELVATPTPPSRTGARYTVRVGKLGIEVDDNFDPGTLRRLVAALAC